MNFRVSLIISLCFSVAALPVCQASPPEADWFLQAPSLPQPTGQVIRVNSTEDLYRAASNVHAGGTILVADGHYRLPKYLEITTDNVTLRSEFGNRHEVVLDGSESRHGELLGISECHGVTVADLTIQNVKYNGIKINSDRGAQRVTVRNCVLHNIWQRGVKASGIEKNAERLSPSHCKIEYCLFYNDRPKAFSDDQTDTPKSFNGNYIGGIDVKNTIDWEITNNVFIGIQGRTREGRGCIYISEAGLRCVIERNIFLDCDIAVALGNPSLEYSKTHAQNCIVQNNLISQCPETGILACYTQDCEISNNTIYDPQSKLGRLIWVQNANDGLKVENNLLVGPPVRVTSESEVSLQNNEVVNDLTATEKAKVGQTFLPDKFFAQIVDLPKQQQAAKDKQESQLQSAVVLSDEVVEAMRNVHADFEGQKGYVAQFGDSITYSMAFWTPIGWDAPEKFLTVDDGLPKTPKETRWRDHVKGTRDKGPKFANYSGWKVGQLNKTVDAVLETEKPETAIIMIGTNDISGGKVPATYRAELTEVLQKCLKAHCIPIVNTIPPRRERNEAVEEINAIIREVAKENKVPLVDFHAEILRLRPGKSWDGTIISKDGVHPSGGKSNEYTEDNMKNCGYALRNWLNFLALRQLQFRVYQPVGEE
jgi:parallel beta-helix repeat protein